MSAVSGEMKAAVIYQAGGPEVLKVESRPIPKPRPGEVLIRVKAFGLNRSELFTRQGHSPNVKFPRILGIEAAGIIEDAPNGEFPKGATVITAMGGLGREFDGGYAEFTRVPARQVHQLDTNLDWKTLGAIPEMFQTSWGSLFTALRLERGERLLIRGGTTSIGLTAAAIAHNYGAIVSSTSRKPDRAEFLRHNGADEVFIDSGAITNDVRKAHPEGVDKVLELVGTTTLLDSLKCARPQGIVCMTGIVGNRWSFDQFSPMDAIPSSVCLTIYDGGIADFMRTPYQEIIAQIKEGKLQVRIGKVFSLDEIVEAHRCMEENKAGGKIVVLT
jgi:NADPH:quinone reductase-like Zn-dependent oxidoreductase